MRSVVHRRDNFNGFAGRARTFASLSAEYLTRTWIFDLTATRRWTTDRIDPVQRDHLYTATVSRGVPKVGLVALSGAHERVGDRSGVYAGVRITRTFSTCSRCLVRGTAFEAPARRRPPGLSE
jgi:hypothetical protein